MPRPVDEIQLELAELRVAKSRILKAQEYTVGQGMNARRVRRADLPAVTAEIERLERELESSQAAGSRRLYNLRPGCR